MTLMIKGHNQLSDIKTYNTKLGLLNANSLFFTFARRIKYMRISFPLNGIILLILILKMVKFDSNRKSIISIEYYHLEKFLSSDLSIINPKTYQAD